MSKTDFKLTLDSYRAKHNEFRIIDMPDMQYLMIDGHGDPNSAKEYKDALETLYPVAYKLKFMSKIELENDYVVPPLEGLWWAQDMETFTSLRDKSQWDWTMMIMTPSWITKSMLSTAIEKATEKGPLPSLHKIRLERLVENTVVQTLHIGSYDDEAPLLEKMHHDFIPNNHYKMVKKHHEIYLGDPRKTAPEKLKTILRQPIELLHK